MKAIDDCEAVLLGASVFDGRYRNLLPLYDKVETNDSLYRITVLTKSWLGKPVYAIELVLVHGLSFGFVQCTQVNKTPITLTVGELYKRLDHVR